MIDLILQLAWPLHLASTFYMVGLIWFVQVVHYPLFAAVGEDKFVAYEDHHQRLTTWVVGPGMLIELVTGVLLALAAAYGRSATILWASMGLLAVIWLSTALIQIPYHRQLSSGFDASAHQRLVRSNWLRTVAWTVRGVLILVLV